MRFCSTVSAVVSGTSNGSPIATETLAKGFGIIPRSQLRADQ